MAQKDLSIGATGNGVAALHSALAKNNVSVPPAEVASKSFGSGTRNAVRRFQGEHGLERTGLVDAETARAINVALHTNSTSYSVSGVVTLPDGTRANGMTMVAS